MKFHRIVLTPRLLCAFALLLSMGALAHAQRDNLALDQTLLAVVQDERVDKIGKGDADKVESLLNQGADPNIRDQRGYPALVDALNLGKDDAAQLLIKKGADFKTPYRRTGENAAWCAAGNIFCPGALELMIKMGCDVTAFDTQGHSILWVVCLSQPCQMPTYPRDRAWTDAEIHAWKQRERRVIDMLLVAGVDINGKSGAETPLMSAVRTGHEEAVRTLLKSGADLSRKNTHGDTALSLAKQFHPELVKVIEAEQSILVTR